MADSGSDDTSIANTELISPRALTSNSIRIDVGEGPGLKSFHAHEAILLAHSGYFRSALTNSIEADTQWDTLPEIDPDIFGLALVWFYTGKIPSAVNDEDDYSRLCRVWLVGEALSAPGLQNYTTKELLRLEHDRESCPPEVLYQVYRGTVKGCVLRKLIVDIYVKRNTGGGEALEYLAKNSVKEELMADIATAALRNLKKTMAWDIRVEEEPYIIRANK